MDPSSAHVWPSLPNSEWGSTLSKLHLWTQMVGKIRMQYDVWVNHSWGVVLHVSREASPRH